MPRDDEPNSVAGVNRRQFLGRSAYNAAGLAAGLAGLAAGAQAHSPNERVQVGVIGTRRQGRKLAKAFASNPQANVHSLCDVDGSVLERACREIAESTSARPPRCVRDYRELLDDREIDAVVIATPDHSHVVLADHAVRAGKDVYLESPVCHSVDEGRQLLRLVETRDEERETREAGDGGRRGTETRRRVTRSPDSSSFNAPLIFPGLFDRSLPHVASAIAYVQSGQLGTVPLVKAWSVQRRPSDGFVESAAPAHVDYAGWLYPCRERPFEASRFHRGWANHWDYGAGDLGTWGVALLDLARWGTGMECPERVSAFGHRIDERGGEIPDTLQVTFASESTTIVWEHRRWSNHAPEGRSTGVAFHGQRGTLVLDRGGWKVYDATEPAGENGRSEVGPHIADFLATARTRRSPVTPLRDAVISANFAHLGNLAYRLGREVRPQSACTPLADDAEARALDLA